ncbi:hypothetical protein ACWGKS_21805 [Nocardiopsis sp. NPDC055879]
MTNTPETSVSPQVEASTGVLLQPSTSNSPGSLVFPWKKPSSTRIKVALVRASHHQVPTSRLSMHQPCCPSLEMVDPATSLKTVREPVTENKSSGHIDRVNSASEGIAPLSHQILLRDDHDGDQ